MLWQDAVLTFGMFVFAASLIFTIREEEKPDIKTCLLSSATLYGFALTYLTLDLWFGAVLAAVVASEWGLIAYQILQRRHAKT